MSSPSKFRSERLSAVLLLAAAVVGLVLANSPVSDAVLGIRGAHLDIPAIGLELSVGHWISDGLLAIFFLIVAIELRHELTHGELDTPRKALVPAIAAVGGVVVPAAIFLVIVRDPDQAAGWPVPTATDVAFALGVLALLGRGLPSRVRALLLALAVLDDLIGIIFIAVFFTAEPKVLPLLAAVPVVIGFGLLSRLLRAGVASATRAGIVTGLIALGLIAWYLVHASGVHPTIAAVALGLVMSPRPAVRLRHALEPWSNGVVLPIFALSAALVVIPDVGVSGLRPVFWGILIALPVGKLIGIVGGAAIASRLIPKAERRATLPAGDVLVVASLGGIGFTVSLLMNELAYRGSEEIAAEGTLAVLAGSLIGLIFGSVVTGLRARDARRSAAASNAATRPDPS